MRVLRLVEERHHRDVEGRPIREGRTPPEHLRPGDIEYRPCLYPGSRHLTQPMNVSALRQTSEHWDAMVDALAWARTRYAAARGSFGPDLMDVWRVSQLCCSLPWYYILTRDEAAPAYASALAKVSLGTALLSHRLLQDAMLQRWVPPRLTSQVLLEFAESTGTLLGETEVCSAPAKMIVEYLDVMIAGTPRGVVGLDDAALSFGAVYTSFKLLLWMHHLARRFVYADLAARPGLADDPELRALLGADCEPPDCFVIEPPDLANVASPMRALWFAALAALVVPIAPDGADRELAERARDVAAIMGVAHAPAAAYAALDEAFGAMLAVVERGLGGTPGELDAATRDRMLAISPRATIARLAT